MPRVLGLIVVLIVLLVGAMLAKRQISGIHASSVPASQASDASVPEVNTPEGARRLTEQVQSDVNRMVDDQTKQLKQNLDDQTP